MTFHVVCYGTFTRVRPRNNWRSNGEVKKMNVEGGKTIRGSCRVATKNRSDWLGEKGLRTAARRGSSRSKATSHVRRIRREWRVAVRGSALTRSSGKLAGHPRNTTEHPSPPPSRPFASARTDPALAPARSPMPPICSTSPTSPIQLASSDGHSIFPVLRIASFQPTCSRDLTKFLSTKIPSP